MREIAFGAAAYPAMNLFKRSAYPQGVNAQVLQIIQLLREALQIAAVEGADLFHAVFMPSITVVIIRIAVFKAIGQNKIDGGVMPAERGFFRGVFRFKQQ